MLLREFVLALLRRRVFRTTHRKKRLEAQKLTLPRLCSARPNNQSTLLPPFKSVRTQRTVAWPVLPHPRPPRISC